MDFEKYPQFAYHVKNNTPTGRIIKAWNDAVEKTNAMLKDLKDLNVKQLQEMVDELKEEIKKCNDTATEAMQRIEELYKRF